VRSLEHQRFIEAEVRFNVEAQAKKTIADRGGTSIPPFEQNWRPDPKSSPCARFRKELPWAASNPEEATAVFQARCEISHLGISSPGKMKLTSDGGVLALWDMGGWKNRDPFFTLVFPDGDSGPVVEGATFKTDFYEAPNDFLVDTSRQLIFGADDRRIKSYRLFSDYDERRKVHTMDPSGYNGPLALLPEGRLIRAGREGLAVWSLDDLPTHGRNGRKIIGKRIKEHDTYRDHDDADDIERSTGVLPTDTISFAEQDSIYSSSPITTWVEHPSDKGSMLCSSQKTSTSLYCRAIDLAAGARTKARYLGHGGPVVSFSTSPGDPNVFLTSCHDGFARLFDVRYPLPVLTLEPVSSDEVLPDAVLGHPGGVPCKSLPF